MELRAQKQGEAVSVSLAGTEGLRGKGNSQRKGMTLPG